MFNYLWLLCTEESLTIHNQQQQHYYNENNRNNGCRHHYLTNDLDDSITITLKPPPVPLKITKKAFELLTTKLAYFPIVNIVIPAVENPFFSILEELKSLVPFLTVTSSPSPLPIEMPTTFEINNEIKYLGVDCNYFITIDENHDKSNILTTATITEASQNQHPLLSPILMKLKNNKTKPIVLKDKEFINPPKDFQILPFIIEFSKLQQTQQQKPQHLQQQNQDYLDSENETILHFQSLNLFAIKRGKLLKVLEPAFFNPDTLLKTKKINKPSMEEEHVFDHSITLRNWKPLKGSSIEDIKNQNEGLIPKMAMSQPITVSKKGGCSIEQDNKASLKRLLHLSLRQMGIEKGGNDEFDTIWHHLYNGCLFAFRKEISKVPIEQQTILRIIRSNLNFLNP